MDQCPAEVEMLLSAYHDGEIDAPTRQAVETHLASCLRCQARLNEFRQLSGLFDGRNPAENAVSAHQRSRLHRAIDRAGDQPLIRLGGTVAAVAASLLIVGLAWLWELPGMATSPAPVEPAGRSVAVAPTEDWLRVAVTLQVEPRFRLADSEGELAEARMTDWMLRGLEGGPARENP